MVFLGRNQVSTPTTFAITTGLLAIVVVVGAGAFFGGMRYGENKTLTNLTPAQAARAFQRGGGSPGAGFGGAGSGRRNGAAGGGFVNGDIVSKDAQSVTVKLADGSTKIVFYSASTTVSKSATGTAADLTAGTAVIVTGTTNSDGSVTATRIQLRAPGEATFGAGGPPGAAAASTPRAAALPAARDQSTSPATAPRAARM